MIYQLCQLCRHSFNTHSVNKPSSFLFEILPTPNSYPIKQISTRVQTEEISTHPYPATRRPFRRKPQRQKKKRGYATAIRKYVSFSCSWYSSFNLTSNHYIHTFIIIPLRSLISLLDFRVVFSKPHFPRPCLAANHRP